MNAQLAKDAKLFRSRREWTAVPSDQRHLLLFESSEWRGIMAPKTELLNGCEQAYLVSMFDPMPKEPII